MDKGVWLRPSRRPDRERRLSQSTVWEHGWVGVLWNVLVRALLPISVHIRCVDHSIFMGVILTLQSVFTSLFEWAAKFLQ